MDIRPLLRTDHLNDCDTDPIPKHSSLDVRADLFDAEVWTVPFFSHRQRHWFLGVVNFQKRELQYLDSLPLSYDNPIVSHGPQFVFSVSDVFG